MSKRPTERTRPLPSGISCSSPRAKASRKTEARKKIEDVLAKVKAGEDFAALAKQFSEDLGSKNDGGLYQDFARGTMVKPFEDAAFSIPAGQISGIVETVYGYHILQIVDRKKETRPLDGVRTEIEAKIKQGRQIDAFSAYMTKLKEKAGFKTSRVLGGCLPSVLDSPGS